MNNKYLADLFSQNVGKKAYITYHISESSDYSSVEGVIESFNAEAQVVVLSSKSGLCISAIRPSILRPSLFL